MHGLCSAAVHEFWFPLRALLAHLLIKRTSPGRLALWPAALGMSLSRLCSPLLRWRLCAMQVTLTRPLGKVPRRRVMSHSEPTQLVFTPGLKLSTRGERQEMSFPGSIYKAGPFEQRQESLKALEGGIESHLPPPSVGWQPEQSRQLNISFPTPFLNAVEFLQVHHAGGVLLP